MSERLEQQGGPTPGPGGQSAGPVGAPRRPSGALRGCLIALIAAGGAGVLVLGLLVVLVAVGMGAAAGGAREGLRLEEVTVGGEPGQPKIACIPVEGLIHGAAVPGMELTPVALVSAQLDRAQRDQSVRGVLLYVNSPGGEITGSDILHNRIKQFRQGPPGKPVVACMLDVATSGAYYVASAAERIIAHPTTITGSIGAVIPLYDATALMEKIGVRSESVTTGRFKQLGSPFAEKSPEQKRLEREILTHVIQQMHAQFVQVVAEGRGMKPEAVRELADGRIFTSRQAIEHGLIDQVGYETDAVEAVKKLAGVQRAHLVRYQRVIRFSDLFAVFARGPRVRLSVERGLPLRGSTRPAFLWSPPAEESGVPLRYP